MKLRKVDWWELPKSKPTIVRVEGKPSVSVLPVHTRETRVETKEVQLDLSPLESLKKDVEKLKKRRPEFVGGSGAVGTYHEVTSNVMRFQPSSFNPGINVIGVRSGVATTIWLPSRLEPNHLISVKDELGVASTAPITIRVYQN